MALQDDLNTISAAFDQVDSATTAIATAQTGIQSRITNLLGQIASATTLEQAQALAARATTEAGNLAPLAASLTAMASSTTDPVPVPVPPTPPVA
jgi:hypothetical protein